MSTSAIAQKMEERIWAYFAACKERQVDAIAACFTPGAVHYLPHIPPLVGGEATARAIIGDLQARGGDYLIDKVFTNVQQSAAAVEWTRTFQQPDRILRGYEYYEFERDSLLISEIRGYYAAPPQRDLARHELMGFDYAARGYNVLA